MSKGRGHGLVEGPMSRLFSAFFGRRLQSVLVTSFIFVAILTAALNTLVISRVINDYLSSAQNERVGRDMDLANGLYQEKLNEVAGIGERTARDPQTITNLSAAIAGDPLALLAIDQVISRKITVPLLGSSEVILVLDRQ